MATGEGKKNGNAYGTFRRNDGSQSNEVDREEKSSRALVGNVSGGESRRNDEIVAGGGSGSSLVDEIKLQCRLAGPIVLASLLSYSFVVVSVMFVGHLGELELSSVSIANSFAVVTGFSVMTGLSTGMETLCGQAYGAKRYHQLGVYLQSSLIVNYSAVIPILIIWLNMEKILSALGQDPEISRLAATYLRNFVPGLFGSAFSAPLVKYLQTQSLVLPIMINSAIAAVLHPFWCYLLIYVLGFGFRGGAIATALSFFLMGFLNITYILWSGSCKKCWGGLAVREAFGLVGMYLTLAVPSVVMTCFEFWAFELLVLASGLLPKPTLELSLLTISLNTVNFADMIPLGLCVAASIRVSNELGANRPDAAKLAMKVVLGLGILDGCVIFVILMLLRNLWGQAFTNVAEVIDYVAQVTPFIAVLTLMDPVAAVMSGVLRGCGRQALGASINLFAYYIVGIPLCIFIGFRLHFNGKGLVMGLVGAIFLQLIFLSISISCTNWKKMAENAQDRVQKAPSEHEALLPSHS